MKWIGITGGIGTGKSTVARLLQKRGFEVIDADALVHQLLDFDPGVQKQILNRFGSGVFDSQGRILRSELGRRVFRNETDRLELESILHPRVQDLVVQKKEQLRRQGVEMAFYDVPLLYEKGLDSQFDFVVVVATDPEIQLERLQKRTGLSRAEALLRINAQLSLTEKIQRAAFVIWNNSDVSALEKTVGQFLQAQKNHPARK